MDLVLALQIATIFVSASSVFLSFIITKTENAKKNRLDIVTKQRIAHMQALREKSSLFLSLIKPMVLRAAKSNNSWEYKKELSQAITDIESFLKICYRKERAIIETVNQIEESAVAYLEGGKDERIDGERIGEISKLAKDFYLKISAYNLADWEFIKKQASGVKMEPKEFFDIYESFFNDFGG